METQQETPQSTAIAEPTETPQETKDVKKEKKKKTKRGELQLAKSMDRTKVKEITSGFIRSFGEYTLLVVAVGVCGFISILGMATGAAVARKLYGDKVLADETLAPTLEV